jgi:hypothetical protein
MARQVAYYIQTPDPTLVWEVTGHTEEHGGRDVSLILAASLPRLDFSLTCPLNEQGEQDVRDAARSVAARGVLRPGDAAEPT